MLFDTKTTKEEAKKPVSEKLNILRHSFQKKKFTIIGREVQKQPENSQRR